MITTHMRKPFFVLFKNFEITKKIKIKTTKIKLVNKGSKNKNKVNVKNKIINPEKNVKKLKKRLMM